MAQKLFDKASLVMIPSQYKEGKIYNIKPEDQSSAFEFERNTGATRVNSQGLIEKSRENLFTYSNEFTNPAWNSFTNGLTRTASNITDPDGGNNAWEITTTATNEHHRLGHTITSGKVKTISFYAKANGYEYVRVWAFSGGNTNSNYFHLSGEGATESPGQLNISSIESVGNGWYRCQCVLDPNNNGVVVISPVPNASTASGTSTYLADGTSGIYLYNAQLEQGLVATDYIETTTSAVYTGIIDNLPRLDYSGTEPALLLEPQRSNLVSNSEYFDTFWSTSSGGTRIHNQIISPEGIQNGTKMYPTSTGSFRGLSKAFGSTLSNTSYALSVFAKAGEFEHLFFYNIGSPDGNNGVWFNLTTGSVGTNQSAWSSAKMEDFGNGWYRCSAVITVGGSSDNLYILLADSNSSVTATKNGTDGLYLYGAQLEEGSYATSYIPTYGTSVTRNEDVCASITTAGDSGLINDYQTSIFIDLAEIISNTTVIRFVTLSALGGAPNPRVLLYANSSYILLQYKVSGQSDIYINSLYTGSNQNKLVMRLDDNKLALFHNGSKVGEQTIVKGNDIENLQLAENPSLDSGYRVNTLLSFPTALTDQECIDLTTL